MVSLSACGQNNTSSQDSTSLPVAVPQPAIVTPVTTGGCGSGPYSFTNSSCLTDFMTACEAVGTVYSSLPQRQICRIPVGPVAINSQNGILNPSDSTGPLTEVKLVVRSGDIISFQGTGSWGTANSSTGSFLFGLFNYSWSSFNCNKVDINGNGENGVASNQGYPMGLIGEVSGTSEVVNIGSHLSQYTVQNAGTMSLGMNAPSGLSGLCGGFSGVISITVQ